MGLGSRENFSVLIYPFWIPPSQRGKGAETSPLAKGRKEEGLLSFNKPIIESEILVDGLIDGDGKTDAFFLRLDEKDLVLGIRDWGEVDIGGAFDLGVMDFEGGFAGLDDPGADAGVTVLGR